MSDDTQKNEQEMNSEQSINNDASNHGFQGINNGVINYNNELAPSAEDRNKTEEEKRAVKILAHVQPACSAPSIWHCKGLENVLCTMTGHKHQ